MKLLILKKMLKELNRKDRKLKTEVFDKFVQSIRSVLCENGEKK